VRDTERSALASPGPRRSTRGTNRGTRAQIDVRPRRTTHSICAIVTGRPLWRT